MRLLIGLVLVGRIVHRGLWGVVLLASVGSGVGGGQAGRGWDVVGEAVHEGLWGDEWGLAEDWGERDFALGVLHAGWLGDAIEVSGFDEALVDVVVAG